MTDEPHTVVRLDRDARRMQEWSLVLSAASIAHRLEHTALGAALVVDARDAPRAGALLADYDAEERRPEPVPLPAPPDYGFTAGPLIAAAALLAFHFYTGERATGSVWFARGAARAERIMDGELWRAVTALTLHADIAHVAANAVFCTVFGTALCRALGPGIGLCLLLAAGAIGNLLNAFLHGWAHSAIGASTAVFGGLGALGALQLARRRRTGSSGRAWAPLAAAFALLAWLGTSPESDVMAHLLGFGVGSVLGAAASFLDRPPRSGVQIAFEVAAVGIIGGCWWWAMGRG